MFWKTDGVMTVLGTSNNEYFLNTFFS